MPVWNAAWLASLILAVAAGPALAALSGNPRLSASPQSQTAAEPLRTPPEYRSRDGVLNVTLTAEPTVVRLGEHVLSGETYNGSYVGPVLRLKRGDVLRLTLVNRLTQATNIHFHGLHVSPQGHGDNAMHMVGPGERWEYVIPIPRDHPPGVYWFHTHAHGHSDEQLTRGLSGTLIIEGDHDRLPATKPLRERLLVLKEFTQPAGDGALAAKPVTVKTINGQISPRIDIRTGETQLWHLSAQTADTYLRLTLGGHSFSIVGRDGHPVALPEVVRELIMAPAQRADVLVTAGAPGTYWLAVEKSLLKPAPDPVPAQALMVVAPNASNPPEPIPPLTGSDQPIPGDQIAARRIISFTENPSDKRFFINNRMFDPNRVDLKVPLGSIEEWTIRNDSDGRHSFHIHQIAFQVISVNGKPVAFDGLIDTIDVPARGEVTIRLPFTNPRIVGRFMYHCHILEHEDKGMMAQMEVYDPKVGPMPDAPSRHMGM